MTADPYATITQDNILPAFHSAMALQNEGRAAEAAVLWDRIATAAPRSAEARFNFGVALMDLERFEDAEQAFRRAAAMKPDAAWAHLRLGNLLHATGRLAEAKSEYETALARDPAGHRTQLDLAQLYLAQGDYARGWPLYEARKEVPGLGAEPLPLPGEWQGEPLAGKRLLVWPEQGLGDQIQFARFVPILAEAGADVTLAAPPELVRLFEGLGVKILERTPEFSLEPPDHWTLIMSIPGRLGITLESLPNAPYLPMPEPPSGAGRGGVGVVWRDSANPHRSLPGSETLQPLADAGAELVDLQDAPGDFADLAALMAPLDIVVTVDTAAAHVAGAIGKPCFVLLPWLKTDWRWMRERTDTPWYPQSRLFRQHSHGEWGPVVAEVAQAWRARFGSRG